MWVVDGGDPGETEARRVRRLVDEGLTAGHEQSLLRLCDLCDVAVDDLDLLSATVSTMTSQGPMMIAHGGDPAGPALVDLQTACGEGPSFDASGRRRPVLVDDLALEGRRRWVEFAPAASALGCAAVWCLPLGVGAARLGVLEMSFARAQEPTEVLRRTTALAFADVATETTLDLEDGRGDVLRHEDAARVVGLRAEVYQAQGMVMVDLGSTPGDALVRMRAYAYTHDLDLLDLARLILSGTVRMSET